MANFLFGEDLQFVKSQTLTKFTKMTAMLSAPLQYTLGFFTLGQWQQHNVDCPSALTFKDGNEVILFTLYGGLDI